MIRTARDRRADAATNMLEHDWWNQNAATIARVWEMAPEVSHSVRGDYLARAKDFFLRGRDRATVLELGCGSGWVGQSIVDSRVNVIGTDFSESQIALAKERARAAGLSAFCNYQVASSDAWPEQARDADSALLHAFLHHLDQEEIDGVISQLRTRLRPGSRIWFYEPAFLPTASNKADAATRVLSRGMHACASVLRVASRALRLRDETTAQKFERLMQSAADNGWYLSPKEVPFSYPEYTRTLQDSFTVLNSYWVTIYLVGWAYECNLLRSPVARRIACATYMPLAARCDRFLAARAERLGPALQAPNHGFAVWECEVPA